jgi:arylsulfatase A-like enzyme
MRYDADGRPATPFPAPVLLGPDKPSRPNVVLVCLDTVRADALAPWATGVPLMPETSAWLRANTTMFRDAHAAGSWTAPSVASLLTGLLPSNHGVREFADATQLVAAIPTLAEILTAAGVRGAAFTGGGWVRESNGMLQGFPSVGEHFSFAEGSALLIRNHRHMPHDVPNFLFLHTYEAHDPYGAPPARMAPAPPPTRHLTAGELAAIDAETLRDGGRALSLRFLADPTTRADVFESAPGRRRLDVVVRWLDRGWRDDPKGAEAVAEAHKAYDAGLARLDRALATYLHGVDEAHALDDAVIVVCADHGEGFGEHGGVHHGRRLYEELTRVPLAIRAPGLPRGAVIEGTCSLLDVMPTILELEGLLPPEAGDGVSLLPLVRGAPGGARLAISEERRSTAAGGETNADLVAVRDEKVTWIGVRERNVLREEAYDRVADPREEHPIPVAEALSKGSEALRRAVEARRR